MMLSSGFLASRGFAVWFLLLGGTLGTFFGSLLAYALAFRFGEAAVLKLGKPFHITGESLSKTKAATEKHEALYIIFSRFIPGVRHIVPYITGIIRLDLRKFILCNAASSLIWCSVFIFAGKLLGRKWTLFERLANTYALAALLVLIFIYLVYRFGGRHRIVIYGVFLPVFAFAAIALLQSARRTHLFDTAVYEFVSGFSGLRVVFQSVSLLDSVGAILLISVVIAALFLKHKTYGIYGLLTFINCAATFALGEIVSLLFHRPRPEMPFFRVILYTFPSVNAMLGISFYGFLIYLAHKLWSRRAPKITFTVLLVLIIAASGTSFIYLHNYFASDVLAGYAAGFSWLMLFTAAVRRLHPFPNKLSETDEG